MQILPEESQISDTATVELPGGGTVVAEVLATDGEGTFGGDTPVIAPAPAVGVPLAREGAVALTVGRSLGNSNDCAIAPELHSRTKPVAIMPHSPLKLSIPLTPPRASNILKRLGRRSIILYVVGGDFCGSRKRLG